jgi:hypothetical protein
MNPFSTPINIPIKIAIKTTSQLDIPVASNLPTITVVIATTLPTETSIPPEMISGVCADAMIPSAVAPTKIVIALSNVKKYSGL